MIFRDPKLQAHCERAVALVADCPADQRPVLGLLDAVFWFRLVEGEDSPRVAEAMEHLLSPELRPALHQWYERCGSGMNEAAIGFRDRLSKLAGEKFG
jgi:hypothetical protein